jgi:hypothetical protein
LITAEELVQDMDNTEEQKCFKLATVVELFENNTAKVQFDGEDEPSEKQYSYLSSYIPAKADRALLGAIGGTYIILGKVNYNVSPDTEEEIDRYLFDLKQVIMKKGLSLTGNADITGDLNVTGNSNVTGTMSVGGIESNGDVTAVGGINCSQASVTNNLTVGTVNITGSDGKVSANSVSSSGRVTGSIVEAKDRFAHTGTLIKFFNAPSYYSQQSISKLSTSADQAAIINKVNELITIFRNYGLLG